MFFDISSIALISDVIIGFLALIPSKRIIPKESLRLGLTIKSTALYN